MEHEIAHLLGMASNLFLLWYDSMTGLRRSPLPQVDSICGFMPGNSTLRLAEPRVGNLDHWELVTPTVQAIVYNQFNCSGHLLGGRLESRGPYSGSDHNACPGSHWDSVSIAKAPTRSRFNIHPLTRDVHIAMVSHRANERWRFRQLPLSFNSYVCRL